MRYFGAHSFHWVQLETTLPSVAELHSKYGLGCFSYIYKLSLKKKLKRATSLQTLYLNIIEPSNSSAYTSSFYLISILSVCKPSPN